MIKKTDNPKTKTVETILCALCGKEIVANPCDNGKSIGGKCECGLFNSRPK